MIAVERFFSFGPDWHQDNRASPLVLRYQATLDEVLESHPELRCRATHCAHCGIRFLTHPRNARRSDLRCPFGCRRHYRRQRRNERSARYYATPHGRRKKKQLNARRSRTGAVAAPPDCPVTPPTSAAPEPRPPGESPAVPTLTLEGVVLDPSSVASSPMLPHIRLLVAMIDGVRLDRQQLVDCLVRALRQHSIARRRTVDYVLAFLNQHPP